MSHKAYLILPDDGTITEVEYDGWESIADLIGAKYIEHVRLDREHRGVYCSDVGAVDGTKYGVFVEGYKEPIFGNVLYVKSTYGEPVDIDVPIIDAADKFTVFQKKPAWIGASPNAPLFLVKSKTPLKIV